MEESGNGTAVFKQRSNYRCFRDGAAFVMKNFNAMFRLLWPFALVYMVLTVALCGYQRVAVVDIVRGNLWPAQAYAMLLSLVTSLAALLYCSVVVWQQRGLATSGSLPRAMLRDVWRELLGEFWRVIKVAVVFGIVACVIFFVGLFLYAMPAPAVDVDAEVASSGGAYWFTVVMGWVVIVCLSLLLLGVACQVCFEYLIGGTGLKAAFGSLRWSRRYFGRGMLMALVSLLVAAVVVAFFSIPSVMCSYIDAISLEMMLNEEVADLPSYYPYISALAWLLTALGYCLATLCMAYPLLLNWGAVHATENLRLEQDTKI